MVKMLLFECQSINVAHQVVLVNTPFPFLEGFFYDHTHLFYLFQCHLGRFQEKSKEWVEIKQLKRKRGEKSQKY